MMAKTCNEQKRQQFRLPRYTNQPNTKLKKNVIGKHASDKEQ